MTEWHYDDLESVWVHESGCFVMAVNLHQQGAEPVRRWTAHDQDGEMIGTECGPRLFLTLDEAKHAAAPQSVTTH